MKKWMVGLVLFGALFAHGADFSGSWSGDWWSDGDGSSGWLKVSLSQDGNYLLGSLDLKTGHYGIFYDVDVTGTVDGNTANIVGELSQDGYRVAFEYVCENLSEDGRSTSGTYILSGLNFSYYDYGSFSMENSDPVSFLTVENGSGGGSYSSGTWVYVNASSPPQGEVFDRWVVSPTKYAGNLVSANSASTSFTMPAEAVVLTATYKLQSLPDLVVTKTTLSSASIFEDEGVDVEVTIKNQSTVALIGRSCAIYVEYNTIIDPDPFPGRLYRTGMPLSLAPGQSMTQGFTCRAGTFEVGAYSFQATVDYFNQILESNTNNNLGTVVTLTVNAQPNHAPSNPLPVSPSNAARARSLTLMLQGSAFSDSDGDSHANTQWQVDDGNGFSSPEWDSGEDWASGVQTLVPAGRLGYSTRYYWRMRYKDSRGAWSEWSYSRSFTTESLVQVIEPDFGGSITPSGNISSGSSRSVTLTAVSNSGYKVKHWLVDGVITAKGQKILTLENITSNMTVEAVFEKVKAMPWLNLLLDDSSDSEGGGSSGSGDGDGGGGGGGDDGDVASTRI